MIVDNNDYLRTSRRTFRLRADVLALMLKGAAWAALACAVALVGAFLLLGLSGLLPDESKTAPDPMPSSSLAAPAPPTWHA